MIWIIGVVLIITWLLWGGYQLIVERARVRRLGKLYLQVGKGDLIAFIIQKGLGGLLKGEPPVGIVVKTPQGEILTKVLEPWDKKIGGLQEKQISKISNNIKTSILRKHEKER